MAATPWRIIPLELPIGEKTYVIQPVDYTDGLELVQVWQGKNKKITDKSPGEALFKMALGPVWDEMLADKVPHNATFRAGMSALDYQLAVLAGQSSEEAVAVAEARWESGIDPEAVAAALEAAAAATRAQMTNGQGSTRSRSTASGNATRSPASTKATTSRQGTQRPANPRKRSASRGNTSSSSGR